MYVDVSSIRQGGKTYTRYLLRESYREDGKVKHRTIANLSGCSAVEIEAIRLALRHKANLSALGTNPSDIVIKQGLSYGAVHVVYEVARCLGIVAALGTTRDGLLRANHEGSIEREYVLTRNGVVGHRLPPVRAATLRLHRGDLLVFATDGVREGFHNDVSLDACPQKTADRILAQHGKATDDALVLVGRWNGARAIEAA